METSMNSQHSRSKNTKEKSEQSNLKQRLNPRYKKQQGDESSVEIRYKMIDYSLFLDDGSICTYKNHINCDFWKFNIFLLRYLSHHICAERDVEAKFLRLVFFWGLCVG
jgi:hypothetical protein